MKEKPLCTHCGLAKVHARGWCSACYVYRHKTGALPSRRVLAHRLQRFERDRLETLVHSSGMICAAEGCAAPVHHRSWCGSHYRRLLRYGDPEAPLLKTNEPLLPNPWIDVAPACPRGHEPKDVYLWHPSPEDGGRWICAPCGRRFDVVEGLRAAS